MTLQRDLEGVTEMDLLLAIAMLFIGLIVLDVLAVTFGADSREGMQDDWAR